VVDCVCKPGKPCMWHSYGVLEGRFSPDEVPFPENYRLIGLPRRCLRFREWLAGKLAPWAFDGPSWDLKASSTTGEGE
jgi:hypothetical protein